jgi:hypothetical protein
VRTIENAIEAVLDSFDDPFRGDEPITFPGCGVPGTVVFEWSQADAAD